MKCCLGLAEKKLFYNMDCHVPPAGDCSRFWLSCLGTLVFFLTKKLHAHDHQYVHRVLNYKE